MKYFLNPNNPLAHIQSTYEIIMTHQVNANKSLKQSKPVLLS